jgi:hypothetical protein
MVQARGLKKSLSEFIRYKLSLPESYRPVTRDLQKEFVELAQESQDFPVKPKGRLEEAFALARKKK